MTIEIRHWGKRGGRENGWVAFVDGWLIYEGLRTSFSLRSADAMPAYGMGGGFYLRLPPGSMVKIDLLTSVMQTNRPAKLRDHVLLQEAFEAWEKIPTPQGEPLLPPRETRTRTMSEAIGRRVAGAAIALVVGATPAFTAPWPWTFLCGCVVFLLTLDIVRRTRRFRQSLALPEALRVR